MKDRMMMKDRMTPWQLGWMLIRLHLKGWRSVPGYTITSADGPDDVYVAMQLHRNRGRVS